MSGVIDADKLLAGGASEDAASRSKPYNEWLRAEFAAYKDEHGLSVRELAGEIGFSSTVVSKYLSGKPEGDVEKLEAVIDDVMRNSMKREKAKTQLIRTNVTRDLEGICETIRKTNAMGLIFGPSGVGKTSGAELYAAKNPTTVFITATAWHRSASSVAELLWNQIKPRHNLWRDSRINFIITKLKGSNRLILVDNAHKLSTGGLAVLFDLHDATDVPVALVGFETVLETINKDPQQSSRIQLKLEAKLRVSKKGKKTDLNDFEELSRALVSQFAPDSGDSLLLMARHVMANHGHVRSLTEQLRLAGEILRAASEDDAELTDDDSKITDDDSKITWVKAFQLAHIKMIRNYKLEVK